MPDRAPSETTNLDRYGNDPLPWSRPHDLLVAGPAQPGTSFFLATTRPDGRPHVAAVGIMWHDGDLYFNSGPGARKAKNLAANPACVMSASLEGIDLVLEGTASMLDDPGLMETLAAKFRTVGWPVEVKDGRLTAPFSAPSAGPPPWDFYRFRFHTGFGVATAEPSGATRWRFDS
jgi:nitroimidazol reductase NimA-like FMN-containing flavoprotein (pyridoxamine 5'-phosphate oxidase superfamily)